MMKSFSKIAVIGPQDSIDDCLQVALEYPNLTLHGFPYESEAQAPELLKSLGNQYDVILFTGPLPFYMTKNQPVLSDIPAVFIPFNGSGLYRALFQIRNLDSFRRISIDTISQEEVHSAFRELGLTDFPNEILEYNQPLAREEYVSYHKNLYDRGEIDVALTCIRSCYQELQKLGVPVVRIFPLLSVIRETLDRVSLIGESLWHKGFQLAVGIVSVNRYGEWSNQKGIHDIQKLQVQVTQSLILFTKEVDGHFIHTGPGEFLFFTTRALIERSTHKFSRPPVVLQQTYLPEELSLSIGIGVGGTANLAAENARIALQKARMEDGNTCYVVNEDHQVIGPLGKNDSSIIELRTTGEFILNAVKKTGLSAPTLNKVFNAIEQAGQDFTVNEVAAFLGMTLRSTRRLLQQLEQANFLKIVGQESVHSRGKPRKVYRLSKSQIRTD
jgi:hypothetical protein